MLIKQAIISAALGCLFSSLVASGGAADEIRDHTGNILYGQIAGFTAGGVVFHQNCGDLGQTFAWADLWEARLSGDCSAAKSWRGGGDPDCEDQGGTYIERPGLVSLEVMPEVVKENEIIPYGMASELLGRDATAVRYINVCTGEVATIPTDDLVLIPVDGYCSTECE